MLRRRVVIAIAIAGIFVAGLWVGSEIAAQGMPKGRVFELRTYTANEGKLPALQARFRDHTTKIFEKHGMKNVGYWVPTDAPGSQNTLIYILSFPDREAAKKSWTAFMNDPEWRKVQQESEANGKLVGKADSVFMEATDYSPIK
jgi:NIPSNAP